VLNTELLIFVKGSVINSIAVAKMLLPWACRRAAR